MPSSHLTSKGQVTIPKPIRQLLKVQPGDRVDFVVDGDQVFLRPITLDLRSLRGLLHRPSVKAVSIQAMNAAVAALHGKDGVSR
jgi:AbrB family looped-hinge helix DNA binding protein